MMTETLPHPIKDGEPVSKVYAPDSAALLPSSVEMQELQDTDKKDLPAKENADKRQLNKSLSSSNVANFQSWILLHQPETISSLRDLSAEQLDSLLASYFKQQWPSGSQGSSSRSLTGAGP
ncbi:uncharacterized protein LOC143528841 [Brachyhypopomus gauderio]|uniref:uncharacterized protein LOC143528841 n=1 Tax=Brachyhypopomus gauderio TaxID=698409 RepID=UPI0040421E76